MSRPPSPPPPPKPQYVRKGVEPVICGILAAIFTVSIALFVIGILLGAVACAS